MERITKEFN